MLSRRNFVRAAGAAVAMPAIARNAFGQTPQFTFKLHHFLPPVANGHGKMLVPWAKSIETDSQGRIKIDIFPSMQLGGTPPQLYDQVKDGVVDIVWTLPGSTAGRFPSSEVFELPFLAARRGIVNAQAAQEFADTYLKDETKDVKGNVMDGVAEVAGLLERYDAVLAKYADPDADYDKIGALQAELEDKIGRADVIDPTKLSGTTIKFGATVTLLDEDTDEKVKYKIVGDLEANLREAKISISSPIARAIIGKVKGDTCEVTAPKGARSLEILKVEWK